MISTQSLGSPRATINLDDQTVQAGHGGLGISSATRLIDCGGARDGGTCIAGTAAKLPEGLTTHRIGSDSFDQNQWRGHVLHDAYFPAALPDTQLQMMTAQDPMA